MESGRGMSNMPLSEYSIQAKADTVSHLSYSKSTSRNKDSLRRRVLSTSRQPFRNKLNTSRLKSSSPEVYHPRTSLVFSDIDHITQLQNTPFTQLPLVPCMSSLKVPLLDNTLLHSYPLSDMPYISELETMAVPATTFVDKETKRTLTKPARLGNLNIPALVHPNSPYVPWTSPTRREILRPWNSSTSSFEIQAADDWRHIASEPVPGLPAETESAKQTPKRLPFVPKNVKSFSNSLKRCFYKATKPLLKHGKRSSPIPATTEDITVPSKDFSFVVCEDPSQSVASLLSSGTDTLAAWLADRQRIFERDSESLKLMTLDEYERVGSWVHTSQRTDISRQGSIVSCRTSIRSDYRSDRYNVSIRRTSTLSGIPSDRNYNYSIPTSLNSPDRIGFNLSGTRS